MTREQELKLKEELTKKFDPLSIQVATNAIVRYEVEISYLETTWKKGLVFLNELNKLGYRITKK
jgi:hypothetical protein